jgi:hypothetical protein
VFLGCLSPRPRSTVEVDDANAKWASWSPPLRSRLIHSSKAIRTAVEFRFNAANGVSCRIETSTDLNSWNTIETDIIGEGGVVTSSAKWRTNWTTGFYSSTSES